MSGKNTSRRTPRARRAAAGRPATIKEVAREAGVGLGTVSRALGSGELVSPETRDRVLAAARRVGYRPSRAAKVLRGVRPRVIGVIIPDLSLPLYAELLRGAGEVARDHDYLLLVCDGQNSQRVMEAQLERLYGEQIDGLVIAGPIHSLPQVARFVASGIPVVPPPATADRGGRDGLRAPLERSAGQAAFARLVELGHRRIAYLAHVGRDQPTLPAMQRHRIDLLRKCLAEAGTTLDEALVVTADGPDACRTKLASLLARDDRPTAFVAGTEALTPPLLSALADARLRIPEDASVIGFGDSPWERAYRPPLSVVRFDYFASGRALVASVIARVEGTRSASPLPQYPSEFVERGSCAPPPAGARRSRAGRR